MALTDIPSIETIKDRIISDVESKISQTVPANRLSFIKVFAGAFAVIFHLLYQTLSWVYKQIFPQTQAEEALRLEGDAIGVDFGTATYAVITASVTGSAGSISAGTTFYGDNQVIYRVDSTTAIPGNVQMTALTAGTIGNLSISDQIFLASAASGIDKTATVFSIVSVAEDDEDIEDYRLRVRLRKRTKFIYGSPAGYALSGLEAPNFIWVGPYADATIPGQVNVYGRVDLSLGTNGIPTTAQLTELENFLRYDNGTGQEIRRPISDTLVVLPVSNNEFDVILTVQNVNAALKLEIESAVDSII